MTRSIEIPKFPLGRRRTTIDTWNQLRLLIAIWSERSRYENHLTLGVKDGASTGSTKHRTDFPRAVRTLAAIKQKEGKTNPYIPKHPRNRCAAPRFNTQRHKRHTPTQAAALVSKREWPTQPLPPGTVLHLRTAVATATPIIQAGRGTYSA